MMSQGSEMMEADEERKRKLEKEEEDDVDRVTKFPKIPEHDEEKKKDEEDDDDDAEKNKKKDEEEDDDAEKNKKKAGDDEKPKKKKSRSRRVAEPYGFLEDRACHMWLVYCRRKKQPLTRYIIKDPVTEYPNMTATEIDMDRTWRQVQEFKGYSTKPGTPVLTKNP